MKYIKEPKPMLNKYDLMHNNTPSYASTVVTWDCSKMGKTTFNRVVKWLETGVSKFSRGEAAAMYEEVRKRFEIPEYVIRNGSSDPKGRGGYLFWEHATPQLMHALNQVYKTERAIVRMDQAGKPNAWMPWYLRDEELTQTDRGYLYIDNVHDLSEIEKLVAEIVNSEVVKERRAQAVDFVKSGGKLEFTWRV